MDSPNQESCHQVEPMETNADLHEETQQLKVELQNKEPTIQSLHEQIQKETQQFKMELQNKESTIQSLHEQIQKETQQFKMELQNKESTIQSLHEQIQKETQQFKMELQNKESTIQSLHEQIQKETQQFKMELQNKESTIQSLETIAQDTYGANVQLTSDLDNQKAMVQSLDDNISRLKTENEHLQTQLKQSQKEVEEKERNNIDLTQKEMEKLKDGLTVERRTLNQRVQKLSGENKGLSDKIHELSQQCALSYDREKKLKLHLTDVETEKKELLLRMSKVASANLVFNNPNIADLSDANRPTKLAEKFSELYDNQWTDAFEAIPSENEEQKTLILLTLLESVNELCHKLANHHKENIEKSFMSIAFEYPFSSTQDSKIQQLDTLMYTKTQKESSEIAANITRNDKNTQDVFERWDNNSSDDAEREKRCFANSEHSFKTNFNSGKHIIITGEKAEPKRQVNSTDVELTKPSENNTHDIINPAEHKVHHNSQEQSISDVNHNNKLPTLTVMKDDDKCVSKTKIDNTDVDSNNANSRVGNIHVSQKPVLHGGLSNNDPNIDVTKGIKDTTALTTAMGNGDTHKHDTKDLIKCNGGDVDSQGNNKTTGHTCAEKRSLDEPNEGSVNKKQHITETKNQEIQQNIKEQSNSDVNHEKALDSKSQANTDINETIIKHSTSTNQKNDEHKAEDNAISIPILDKTNNCERDDTILSQQQLTDSSTISKEEDKSCGTLDKAVQVELHDRNNVATWTSPLYHIKSDTNFDEFSKEQKKTVQDMSKTAEFHLTRDTVDLITKLVSSSSRIFQDKYVRKYIQDSAEICWSMQLHHPPVHIDFVKETNQPFDNIAYRHYTKTGQRLDYLVWPSLYLHKDGPMLSKGVAQGV